MRYFIGYIGTRNEGLDNIVKRLEDLLNELNGCSYCIVLTFSDEVHISEVTPEEFYEQTAALN
jgi:recombinational DNA repair protein RecR